MIVYIYEKLSQNINHFVEPKPMDSINISYYVSNGYLVFTPDIVYTIGYPGQSALKCVLAGVNAVAARGFVDEKNIGIQGHSWGGYQIAYMVTQTNRFKAVEAGAPVANMISAYDGIRWGPGLPAPVPVREDAEPHRRNDLGISAALHRELAHLHGRPRPDAHPDAAQRRRRRGAVVSGHRVLSWRCAAWAKKSTCSPTTANRTTCAAAPNQKDYAIRMAQYFDYELKAGPKPAWMEKGIPYLHTPTPNWRQTSNVSRYLVNNAILPDLDQPPIGIPEEDLPDPSVRNQIRAYIQSQTHSAAAPPHPHPPPQTPHGSPAC